MFKMATTGLILSITLWLAPLRLRGQELVQCRLQRGADSTLSGTCLRGDTAILRMTLRQARKPDGLWRGSARLSYRPSEEPLSADLRPNGTLRTGTAWFDIKELNADGRGLRFSFDLARRSAPTVLDIAILRQALAYLPDSAHWNPADERDAAAEPSRGFDCPSQPTARTLFCALYDASVAVAGEYFHGRPAVDAVRAAIGAAGVQGLQHPLTDYNNVPGMTVAGVRLIFEDAIARLEKQLRGTLPN